MKKGDRVVCTRDYGQITEGMQGVLLDLDDYEVKWDNMRGKLHCGNQRNYKLADIYFMCEGGIELLNSSNLKLNYLIL